MTKNRLPTIELIYTAGCPNLSSARERICRALNELALPERWIEWDANVPEVPERVRRYASPTILVDGSDIIDDQPADVGTSCRIYVNAEGMMSGVPGVRSIVDAVRRRYRDLG